MEQLDFFNVVDVRQDFTITKYSKDKYHISYLCNCGEYHADSLLRVTKNTIDMDKALKEINLLISKLTSDKSYSIDKKMKMLYKHVKLLAKKHHFLTDGM